MRGRKPKPTEIKRAAGNPGRRPLNNAEPAFARGIGKIPEVLEEDEWAAKEWHRIARELNRAGVVKSVDKAALASYCMAWSRWVGAELELRKEGVVVKTSNGNLIQNPRLGVANRAMEQMRQFAVEFGMTPSSRSRIKVEQASEKSLAEMLFDAEVEK